MGHTGVDLVVLPLDDASDRRHLLLPATVVASWFGAQLQLVVPAHSQVAPLTVVANGLGVPAEPVASLDGRDLSTWIDAEVPSPERSMCLIGNGWPEANVATTIRQPTLIVTERRRTRMSTGPLVVPLAGHPSDTDALAVAAIWARALDLRVRLLVDAHDPPAPADLGAAVERLGEMGVAHDLDRVHGHGGRPEVAVAGSRSATALAIPADRLDEATVRRADEEGVSLLVVPPLTATGSGDHALEERAAGRPSPVGEDEATMTRGECLRRLAERSAGRLGYIDDSWPTVVPVNYAVMNDHIFIRSLPGAKLAAAERSDIVCLQIDHFDPDARSGWSVLAHGPLEVISDPQTLRAAWTNDPEPWVTADEWHWLRLTPLSLTGREIPARHDG